MEWLLGFPKISEFPFSFCLCFERNAVFFVEVCGTGAIILHLRIPWFSTKHSEDAGVLPERHLLLRKHALVHHDGAGSPLHSKAEGCVCGGEGVQLPLS